MRSLLYEIERAHDISVAMQAVDPTVIAGAEAEAFTACLKAAAGSLAEAVTIVVRVGRATKYPDYSARAESTQGEP